MKVALNVACVVGATTSLLSAAIVQYPGLDGSFSAPGSVAVTQTAGPVTLDAAAGQFTDPDSGSASASATRYYGGIMTYSPNASADWGGSIELIFTRNDNDTSLRFGKPAGSSVWYMSGNASSFNTGISGSGEMPFVIKIVDMGWNVARADIFVGANAQATTEGAPNGFVSVINANSTSFVRDVRVTFGAADWATGASSGSVQGVFSGTEWAPVVVPEPTSLAFVAVGGLLALRRRVTER